MGRIVKGVSVPDYIKAGTPEESEFVRLSSTSIDELVSEMNRRLAQEEGFAAFKKIYRKLGVDDYLYTQHLDTPAAVRRHLVKRLESFTVGPIEPDILMLWIWNGEINRLIAWESRMIELGDLDPADRTNVTPFNAPAWTLDLYRTLAKMNKKERKTYL